MILGGLSATPASAARLSAVQASGKGLAIPARGVRVPKARASGNGTVSGVSASVSGPTAAAGGVSGYTVGFTVSSTGGLSGAAGSYLRFAFPSSVGLASATAVVTDTTTGQQVVDVGCCSLGGSTTAQLPIEGGAVVNPGDVLSAQFEDVVNPAPAGSYTVSVSTSSDPAPVTSSAFTIVAAQKVSGVLLTLSNAGAATAGASYQVSVVTSSTGGLSGAAGSYLRFTFPSSVGLASATAVVTDTTTGQQVVDVGCCSLGGLATVQLPIEGGAVVNPGDVLSAQFDNVVNPAQVGSYTVSVSTSSDPAPGTASFMVVPSSAASGTVTDANGNPVSGAPVQACPASGSACARATSGSDGMFIVYDLVAGQYTIVAYPPPNGGETQSAPDTVTAAPPNPITGIALQLPDTVVMPSGSTLTTPSGTVSDTVPTINWGEPTTYTTTGCSNGVGMLTVYGVSTSTGQAEAQLFPMTESPAGSGRYSVSIPALNPVHGASSVQQSIVCPGHTSILPQGGSSAGGGQVVLASSGGAFTGVTAVAFGGSPATSFTVQNASVITATAPAGTGSAPVTVTTSAGNIAVGDYSYFDVTGVSTSGCTSGCGGSSTGGTQVTITGDGFSAATGVMFGLQPATSFDVVSPTEITATSPVGVGTVDVQVVKGFSVSQAVTADYYSYSGGPAGGSSLAEGTTGASQASYANALLELPPFPGCPPDDSTGICQSVQQYYQGIQQFLDWLNDEINPLSGGFWLEPILGAAALYFFDLEAGPLLAALAALYAGYKIACAVAGKCPSFSMFIDPSGTVVDTNGNPVSGATATLLGQNAPDSPYTPVPASSGDVEPAVNPETTGSSGQFQWDALAGNYEVQASAPGCTAPGEPAQDSVTSAAFTIPPPEDGLLLKLACGSSSPPTPAVTGLSPTSGATAGYTSVTITGTGLADATGVSFGSTPAVGFTELSPFSIDAIAPPGASTKHVTVTTPGGTSATSPASEFTYATAPIASGAPKITSISPASGPLAGGTTVTISGMYLTSAAGVSFGAATTTQITIVSSTKIKVTVPAGQGGGPVAVTVTTGAAESAPSSAGRYTYLFPQAVSFTSAPPSPATYGSTYTPTATGGGSGEPVTFSIAAKSSKVCTISNSVVTFTGIGTCTIDASQVGSGNYANAPQAQQPIEVSPAPLTVTVVNKSRQTGTVNPTLTASLSGFVLGQTKATSGVKGTAACTTTATVNSPPGKYPITCSQGSLEAAKYSFATFIAGTLTIK
jgi:hypothetical protein